ncbi:(2Fe-2S)-binding protein [Streptomyces sp. NPDC001941]|uniref:(2Fe-2S)-binding protein n=1 Tax=Streptomyces sp. NPDC001941 TaxID=3154659 RepID=UPI003327193D
MDLTEAGSVGGFFALRTDAPDGARGVPLARLYAGDTAPLTARVDRVAARLAAPERRVAASIAHLGLAARLWSTALGPAVLHGRFPALGPGELHWDGERSSPDDLWWSGTATRPATAADLHEAVVEAHLDPLARAFARDGRVARGLLRGNEGSALAGAVRELTRWARREDRPEAARRAWELADALFATRELTGTVSGPDRRRRTCCLYYRCPGGGLCGDCVFDRPPHRGSSARAASG